MWPLAMTDFFSLICSHLSLSRYAQEKPCYTCIGHR